MRLFTGIELDEDARDAATRAAGELRAVLSGHVPGLDARWVPRANLHLTLLFIGETDEPEAAALQAALSRAPLTGGPFEVAFGACGAFPRTGVPRVLWLSVADGAARLIDTHAEIVERLAPFGIEPEARPYTPHLTLARVRESPRGSARAFRTAIEQVPRSGHRMTVRAVTLFRSRLAPRGAAYEPLLRVPLA